MSDGRGCKCCQIDAAVRLDHTIAVDLVAQLERRDLFGLARYLRHDIGRLYSFFRGSRREGQQRQYCG